MDIYKYFIYGIFAYIVGVFSLGNVFWTIFYTIPRLKKEKRDGNLIKSVPIYFIYMPIFFWTLLITCGLYFSCRYYSDHVTQIGIGSVLALLSVAKPSPKKFNDLNDEFKNHFKDYL
jgi:hypothetical protein